MPDNYQITVVQRDEPKHADGYRYKLLKWEKSKPGFFSTYDRAVACGYYRTEADAKRALAQIDK